MQFIHVSQNLQINFFPNLNCDDAKFIHYHDRQRSYKVLHNKIPFKCWGQIASPYSTVYTGADNFVFMAKLLMPHLTLSIIEFPESDVKNTFKSISPHLPSFLNPLLRYSSRALFSSPFAGPVTGADSTVFSSFVLPNTSLIC